LLSWLSAHRDVIDVSAGSALFELLHTPARAKLVAFIFDFGFLIRSVPRIGRSIVFRDWIIFGSAESVLRGDAVEMMVNVLWASGHRGLHPYPPPEDMAITYIYVRIPGGKSGDSMNLCATPRSIYRRKTISPATAATLSERSGHEPVEQNPLDWSKLTQTGLNRTPPFEKKSHIPAQQAL
jgi:hypothetical protein